MKTPKTSRMLKVSMRHRRILLVLLALPCAGLALFVIVTFPFSSDSLPSFAEVRAAHTRSESVLLDRHGQIIHEQRTDANARRLDWVPLAQVSAAFPAALLHAEDRRFYRHHGVDWISLAGALAGMITSEARGASTITMQLVAHLNDELQPARVRRSVVQKLRQIRDARSLELTWSKDQILEAYLNLVTYRGELQGLAAAARGLFGKQVHGLTVTESLVLAALVRSPNAGINQVGGRACMLASAMELKLEPEEITSCVSAALSHPYYIRPRAALAPHVAQRLFTEVAGRDGAPPAQVQCTLDRELQQFVSDTLERHLLRVRSQNVRDGAVLVLDNASGEVLAYVGNAGEQGSARYVDGIRALRQAGSTLKPFIYGIALDRRILTAASLLDDSPLDIAVAGGIYRPGNYDRLFHGAVTVRTALASSLNVPAVKTLNLVGTETALRVLRIAGFEKLQADEFYGPSLALGAADVSLRELTNAYRCIANRGVWTPVNFTFESTGGESRRVFSPEAAFIISDILSDRESRSRTFGLESALATRFWTAVKTGTSKDMRDNWCVGFSDRYTVGVWAGNFSGEPMWNVSGITGAAPVWVDVMNRLHRDHTSNVPPPPPGVTHAPKVPGHTDWFLRGTETATIMDTARPGARIAYPAAGTVVALDPDIPFEEQKLFFEADAVDDMVQWVLDGIRLGPSGGLFLWTPVRGRHELALIDRSGQVLDSVTFEVRGYLPDDNQGKSKEPGLGTDHSLDFAAADGGGSRNRDLRHREMP